MFRYALALGCAFACTGAQAQRRAGPAASATSTLAPAPGCKAPQKLSAADAAFDLKACPSLEPQFALSRPADAPADYHPKDVDWRSLVKAIEYVADKEPRYCNFVIRAHFHDAGSLGNDAPAPASVYGSDGSMHLDKFEFLQPENAYDAFALFSRTVNTEFVRFFGSSFADTLNVAAFTCVRKLGAVAPIPQACDAAGVPLYAGKLDANFAFTKNAARARTDHLPGPFQETPIWMHFWLEVLNEQAESAVWKFDSGEALALMGSHTLIDNQACTTASSQPKNTPKDPSDAQCAGRKRMFTWNNSYYVDVTSGKCEPRGVTPANAEWFPTSDLDAKGRAPNDAEHKVLANCVWQSQAGKAMGQNLECVVHRAAAELGIGEIPEDNDFRFVDWYPDSTRYPCCGYHCQTCPGNDIQDPYYCPNSPKDTSFWFYTWQDCDLIYSSRLSDNVAEYCAGKVDCGRFMGGDQKALAAELKKLAGYYAEFRGNNAAWQQEYAKGHCKLNNMGAIYSNGKTELLPLLDTCKGTFKNGVCSTDPVNGKIAKEAACVGSTNNLVLTGLISKKTCEDCSDAVRKPIALPEQGELKPGQRIAKGKGELITEVGQI